jgi:hypothetical protein
MNCGEGLSHVKSILPSLEFLPKGDIAVKFDICAHCVFSNDLAARNASLVQAQQMGFNCEDYDAVLKEVSQGIIMQEMLECHAFFGIGLSADGDNRFNIYLKPSLRVRVT